MISPSKSTQHDSPEEDLMTTLIRRTLLISSTAVIALAVMPAIGAMAPVSLSGWVAQQAQASGDDDGDDDSGDDSGSGGGSGGSGSGGGSGGGSSDSGDDDGPDHDSGDDNGGDRDDDDSDDDDSADDDSADDSDDDSGKSRSRGGDRDEIRLIVNDNQLQGLLSGSMIPVDQNGKRLRFEVEQEHGNTEIKLRAPKGTLTSVTVIPAP
jgi:hypothetical protein